jgi:hypothetical protein
MSIAVTACTVLSCLRVAFAQRYEGCRTEHKLAGSMLVQRCARLADELGVSGPISFSLDDDVYDLYGYLQQMGIPRDGCWPVLASAEPRPDGSSLHSLTILSTSCRKAVHSMCAVLRQAAAMTALIWDEGWGPYEGPFTERVQEVEIVSQLQCLTALRHLRWPEGLDFEASTVAALVHLTYLDATRVEMEDDDVALATALAKTINGLTALQQLHLPHVIGGPDALTAFSLGLEHTVSLTHVS